MEEEPDFGDIFQKSKFKQDDHRTRNDTIKEESEPNMDDIFADFSGDKKGGSEEEEVNVDDVQ